MNKIEKKIYVTAALAGFTAIILGAIAAHGLENLKKTDSFESFQTGVRYQIYHSFFLFILGLIPVLNEIQKKQIFWLISVGIILFSFSIYALSTNELTDFDFAFLGPVTPLGGVFLLLGWLCFIYNLIKFKKQINI